MEHLTQQEVMKLVYKVNGEIALTEEEEKRLSHTLECEECEKQIAQCLEILKFMQPDYVQSFVSKIGGKKKSWEDEEDEFDQELAEYREEMEEE